MALILALLGGAPPADGGIPWQVVDWCIVDEEEEDATWISAVYEAIAAAQPDPITTCAVDDDEVEEVPEQYGQFTPPLNDFIPGCFAVDDDAEDEVDAALVGIFESVAAADEFIQAVLDADLDDSEDDGLFDAGWNAAFDPPPEPPLTPSPPSLGAGSFMGTYPRGEPTPPKDKYNEEEELELAMLAVIIIRTLH